MNLTFKMVKDDHLLYVVSSKVMTKNHRYECQIKGGDFNMDGLKESRKKRDISDVGSERGLGGVMYDETMRMYVPKAHELGCRHDWVHCAEIICQISNLGVSEIAHIEIESYVAQQALQHHFSGKYGAISYLITLFFIFDPGSLFCLRRIYDSVSD